MITLLQNGIWLGEDHSIFKQLCLQLLSRYKTSLREFENDLLAGQDCAAGPRAPKASWIRLFRLLNI